MKDGWVVGYDDGCEVGVGVMAIGSKPVSVVVAEGVYGVV